MQKTVLNQIHKKLNGKLVNFSGWEMPVFYTSVLKEHENVRQKVGLFDVSHMGEIVVEGKTALDLLQWVTTNDVAKLGVGEGQYTLMCKPGGGIVDDLILYRLKETSYLLCVNAGNTSKDYEWIESHNHKFNAVLRNESANWSQIAVQGPLSPQVMRSLLDSANKQVFDNLSFGEIGSLSLAGNEALVARTGYTGEKGYEIYCDNSQAVGIWSELLERGAEWGVCPVGLGARDTLRLEACFPLYGNDLDETISPLEAGLAWTVKFDAKDFVGKEVLAKQKEVKPSRRSYGFCLKEPGIPRAGMAVYRGTQEVGKVTSGSVLPAVGGAGGLALLPTSIKVGDEIEVDVRGKRKLAIIMKKPLYQSRTKK